MSIPLDRLYHYIESIAQEVYGNTIIYHFWPHGSKNIKDLNFIRDFSEVEVLTNPQIFCNDQEPLDFDLYSNYNFYYIPKEVHTTQSQHFFNHNLRKNSFNMFDQCILIHSEKNSIEVDKYSANGFIPVYYWSHALIALDWFRYAKHIKITPDSTKVNFLLYNRAWSGTREYRLKLADLLIEYDLVKDCKTSIAFNDNQTYYANHVYRNPIWKPKNHLEDYFTENTTTPCYSADFNCTDYQSTWCEVVLETLFDSPQLQLTEKILRPIALGHPFLLCAPAGSLQYLRDYGFKTFSPIVNEEYDLLTDPVERLTSIVKTMKTISNWGPDEKHKNFQQMKDIADFNRDYFFSDKFFNLITKELKNNLQQGLQFLIESNTFDRCIELNWSVDNNPRYQEWKKSRLDKYQYLFDANKIAYETALNLKQVLNK